MAITDKKPITALKVLIWLVLIPTLFGQFFKIQHWPGAAVLLLAGSFFFAAFYIPLFFSERIKTLSSRRQKIAVAFRCIFLFIYTAGIIFKTMHWPGAAFLYFLNTILLVTVVLPVAIVQLVKAGRESLVKTHNIFLVLFFFTHFFSMLINSGSGKVNVNAVLQQGLNTEEALKASTSRNKQLYLTLAQLDRKSSPEIFTKAEKLKRFTDTTLNYMKGLKSFLLVNIDGVPKKEADTMSCLNILRKTDNDLPSRYMLGQVPGNKQFTGAGLKRFIDNYRDSLLNQVQEQNRGIIKEGLNLNTDNYEDENGEPVTWVDANFSNMPLLYVHSTLTNLQYEVRNAEYQVLTDIINSGNKDLNSALFSQVADLNRKYNEAKKEEEIAKLRNENKKGVDLLLLKNSQLDESQQTIVVFVFVTLVFVVLVFFTIRSNILRKKANKVLTQQKEIIESQKTEVESQKHLIEEKQKEIIDSISYAKRLQEAILPPAQFVNENVAQNFILYKPKDIVAGDFYWAEKIDDMFFIAAADSTGHGVPGAMVSVVCSNALNRTVKEFGITGTGKILDKTRELVLQTFEKSTSEVKDGMDVSLLCINKTKNLVNWSGANNPLWYIENGELKEIKGDKQPIGKTDNPKPFTSHTIQLTQGTQFYLFTDGFADQFGGPNGKKFKYKQFSDFLLQNYLKPQEEQKNLIDQAFENWKGSLEQVDDVCVIGVKI